MESLATSPSTRSELAYDLLFWVALKKSVYFIKRFMPLFTPTVMRSMSFILFVRVGAYH